VSIALRLVEAQLYWHFVMMNFKLLFVSFNRVKLYEVFLSPSWLSNDFLEDFRLELPMQRTQQLISFYLGKFQHFFMPPKAKQVNLVYKSTFGIDLFVSDDQKYFPRR
jgi:hypothetical protein